MKLLVIEDEPELNQLIVNSLQKEQYVVEVAENYTTALEKVMVYDYDCIILDIMLPGGSGLDILDALKKAEKTDSVIIVSAKNSLDDKLTGLNMGADDYLPKPFHMAELTARVKSVIRRKKFSGNAGIVYGNLELSFDHRNVLVNGSDLLLNRKEFEILQYFLVNKNRLVTKTALAEHVWGDQADEADNYEFIYSQIKNLRKKLKDVGADVKIQAVYGVGYKLTEA